MCKGLAVGIDDKRIISGGNSHSEMFKQHSKKEDAFLKINILFDSSLDVGYRIELDNHGNSQMQHYQSLGMIDAQGCIIPSYQKRLKAWAGENQATIFKTLCQNLQDATIEGYQSNHRAIITKMFLSGLVIKNNKRLTAFIKKLSKNDNCLTLSDLVREAVKQGVEV